MQHYEILSLTVALSEALSIKEMKKEQKKMEKTGCPNLATLKH